MNIKRTKKAKIIYSKRDKLRKDDFRPEKIGHRISIVIPEDILMAFRRRAIEQGMGYQTLINQTLRETILKHGGKRARSFETRLIKLEKAIFDVKKKAA